MSSRIVPLAPSAPSAQEIPAATSPHEHEHSEKSVMEWFQTSAVDFVMQTADVASDAIAERQRHSEATTGWRYTWFLKPVLILAGVLFVIAAYRFLAVRVRRYMYVRNESKRIKRKKID